MSEFEVVVRTQTAARSAFADGATAGIGSADEPPQQLALVEAPAPYRVPDRAGRKAEALRLAEGGEVWTSKNYAHHFGVSQATAWKDLTELVDAGDLEAVGSRRSRQYRWPGQP